MYNGPNALDKWICWIESFTSSVPKNHRFFGTFQHLQVGRKKAANDFTQKMMWTQKLRGFFGRNNSPSWNITMMFRSVPQFHNIPWGADSGIPASKPSHGEKHRMPRWASETFLVFFLGGEGAKKERWGQNILRFWSWKKDIAFFFAGGVKGAQTVSAGEGIKIRTIYKLNFPYSPLFFDPSFLETGCCTGCFRVGHLPFVWRFPLSSLLMWFSPEEITTLGALTDIYFNHVILPLMVQKIFANQLRLVVDSTIIPLTTVLYHIAFFIFFLPKYTITYSNIFYSLTLFLLIQYFSCNCNIFKIILHCLLFCNVISNYIDILD